MSGRKPRFCVDCGTAVCRHTRANPNLTPARPNPSPGRNKALKKAPEISVEEQLSQLDLAAPRLGFNLADVVVGSVIDRGSYGIVHKGRCPSGKILAVKLVDVSASKLTDAQRISIHREIQTITNLPDHENIVRTYGVKSYENPPDTVGIYMDYVEGGSLDTAIREFGAFREETAANYIKDLLDAVSFIHSRGITHRDIKSANCLLKLFPDRTKLLLSDFGCSREFLGEAQMASFIGTPVFMAPETITGCYTSKCDIWSIGCVAYHTVTAHVPPLNKAHAFLAAYNAENISPHLKRFVQATWREEEKRATVLSLKKYVFITNK